MSQPEFDPVAHEEFVRDLHESSYRRIARVALFDEMIDFYHDGQCSFDEAVSQFQHDAEVGGFGYEAKA